MALDRLPRTPSAKASAIDSERVYHFGRTHLRAYRRATLGGWTFPLPDNAEPRPSKGGGNGLVFTTSAGMPMDAANVLVIFAALSPWSPAPTGEWTPRELRHSFVSVLSDAGIPVEQIAQLVGRSGTTVTELVYRHQLRPVI